MEEHIKYDVNDQVRKIKINSFEKLKLTLSHVCSALFNVQTAVLRKISQLRSEAPRKAKQAVERKQLIIIIEVVSGIVLEL